MINIEPYSTTSSRSPSPSLSSEPAAAAAASTTAATSSTEQTASSQGTKTSIDDVSSVTDSFSTLTVASPTSTATTATAATATEEEPKEELSPEEAKLRAQGLKSTHRPGFFIHLNSPKRLRIQTQSKTFDLDRYCPHANADMLKWGVLRDNNTLRCGVHYWGFDLTKNGQCIAHPDETLNACPVDSGLEW